MSIARYRKLLALARQDAELFAWLADGLAALEDGDGLAAALGLAGGRAMVNRNRLIVEAGETAAPHKSPWEQAGALEKAIARAEVTRDKSKLCAMIRDISLYSRIPRIWRQIYAIIIAEKLS